MADMNNLTSEMTAGQMLRAARTTGRRKRELSTVARLLCIKEAFLEALENDEFDKIGELVYVLGFARNYAMELELDPYIIVERIKKQMGLIEEADEIEIEGERPSEIAEKSQFQVKATDWIRKNLRIVLISLSAVIGVITIGSMIFGETESNSEEAVEISDSSKYNLPITHEYGLRNKDYASVVLQATGSVWVQIKNATGAVIFEHSLVAGDVYYALNGTTATIGNAGALDIWVAGKLITKVGADHQRIADLLLTPENLVKN